MTGARPPVIVLGAPRSGTNLLRDLLTAQPGFTTWPCDEINAIWRHGQAAAVPDDLPPAALTDAGRRCIRRAFARRARFGRVVEKTCANTLRVPYVAAAVPEAVFVLIERIPEDAVASAMARWQGSTTLGYLLRKLRWVPPADLPGLVLAGGRRRLAQWHSPERRMPLWGPVFPGLAEAAAQRPLAEVCALQWLACNSGARAGLASLPDAAVHRLRYETLVMYPERTLTDLLEKLGAVIRPAMVRAAAGTVSAASIGRGARVLSKDERRMIARVVAADG